MKTGDPSRPSQQHQVQQSDAERGRREASQREQAHGHDARQQQCAPAQATQEEEE